MNPELIKLARELMAAQRRAEKAGTPATPQEQEEFIQQKSGGKYSLGDVQTVMSRTSPRGLTGNVRGLMTSAIQGVTFGFGDEIVQRMPEALGGGEAAAEEMRFADEQYRAAHPVASTAAAAAGGFAVPAIGAARFIPALARGGRGAVAAIGAAGTAGAVMGAAQGAGDAQPGQRLAGAVRGAAIGAPTGAILGGAGARLNRARTGAEVIPGKLRESIRRDTPEIEANLAEAASTGRGGVVALANLSARMHGIADLVATRSVEAKARLSQLVGRQQAGANARIANGIPRVGPAAPARLRTLKKERQTWAGSDDGFEGLRKVNPDVDPTGILPLLTNPKFIETLEKARETGLIGRVPDLGRPSFSQLQDVKEMLDDAATAAFRQKKGNLGRRIAETRDDLVAAMEVAVPDYAPRSAEYARRLGLENAVRQGQAAWRAGTVEDIEEIMRDISPEQLNEFRIGMAHGLRSVVQRTKPDRKLATKIVGSQGSGAEPLLQRKLEVVFGDQDTFMEFMRGTRVEKKIGDLSSAVSGSQTAERTGQAARSAAVSFAQNPVRAAWQSTLGRAADKVEQKNARQSARVLESSGTKLREVLELINRQDLIPLMGAAGGQAATRGLFGQP